MTQRKRTAVAIATNFEKHVRAMAEMAALAIVRGTAGRAAELCQVLSECEAEYKRLVYDEAMRRLGVAVGRPARRRIQEKGIS
jgi:hypothetical protein